MIVSISLTIAPLAHANDTISNVNIQKLITADVGGQDAVRLHKSSDVVIYEFMDYQCFGCKRLYQTFKHIKQQTPDLQVRYMDYPIYGEVSTMGAVVAIALFDQGLYDQMHDILMSNKQRLTIQKINAMVTQIGADKTQLENSIKTMKPSKIIAQNLQLGQDLDIPGTPYSMLISPDKNGKLIGQRIIGSVPATTIAQLIQKYKND